MDSFVRKLVRHLNSPASPLSRNRHFHTFETPEGRMALRIARRLRSLQRDILDCCNEGHPPRLVRRRDGKGEHRLLLVLRRLSASRTCALRPGELELLRELPGIDEVLPAPEDEGSSPPLS
jgi:hypothetical protein